jgi:4-diphosphocytidyl-2-C-methyl-D-erythritol kinase
LDRLKLRSPAKINLFLDILGKREDGYHEIRTLMQAVDLCDRLILQKTEKGIGISCDHPTCPSDERNLAFKAAFLLQKEENIKAGVDIRIEKRIPISAGLGGGSSNAAATLVGLNRLYDMGLPVDRLQKLGEQIGSDVPFFLYSGQALAKGRGEKIVPISLFRDYWLVLACPGFQVHSGWAYRKVKINLTRDIKEVNYKLLENRNGFFDALPMFKNDLEEAVAGEYPILRRLKDILKNSGAVKTSMSGSGPTVYGLFDRKPKAQEVARKLSQGDWQVFLTQPILLTFESLG